MMRRSTVVSCVLAVVALFALLSGCATRGIHPLAADLVKHTVALKDSDGRTYCSGVAITPTRLLTAKHCVMSGEAHSVKLYDGRVLPIVVERQSTKYDIAVLSVATPVLDPARMGDASKVAVGDFVIAVGNPFGVEWTVTPGYVSLVNFELPEYTGGKHFQITAIVNPGNSGGPLFNEAGELIAINNFGRIGSGLNYSLALDQVKDDVL